MNQQDNPRTKWKGECGWGQCFPSDIEPRSLAMLYEMQAQNEVIKQFMPTLLLLFFHVSLSVSPGCRATSTRVLENSFHVPSSPLLQTVPLDTQMFPYFLHSTSRLTALVAADCIRIADENVFSWTY